jgi:phytol kinase
MLNAFFLSTHFLTLFAFAEVLHRKYRLESEYTRKFVHIGTGLLTLLFPLMLRSHWEVLLLCSGFAALLLISRRGGYLPSINGIRRISHGSLCYPAAVYLAFFVYDCMKQQEHPTWPPLLYFYAPILTMALCDPLAALTGRRLPLRVFKIGADVKSVGGSAAFLGSAWLLNAGLLLAFQTGGGSVGQVFGLAFALAAATCLVEACTPYGLDNFTIPVAALCVLFSASYTG